MHGDLEATDNCNEYVLTDQVQEVHIYKQVSPPQVVGLAIKFKSYTDISVDGTVISVGNTVAVAAAPGVTAVNKYVVSMPTGNANQYFFWGFQSSQEWDDPVTP